MKNKILTFVLVYVICAIIGIFLYFKNNSTEDFSKEFNDVCLDIKLGVIKCEQIINKI